MKLLLILFLSAIFCFPQQSKISKGVNYISGFIASEYFEELQTKMNDLALMDSIFIRAVEFYEGDIDEALLALTFAVVPYNQVPIQIPLLKIIVKYPLISSDQETFLRKNKNLPKYLFFDSPRNDYGDKDKPAHFFGSAYISYASNIFDLGDLIGYFVEVFEESFKVQSSIDERDLAANKLGNIFGEALKKDKYLLPSNVLIIPALKNFVYGI
jgi:hypothetical protein